MKHRTINEAIELVDSEDMLRRNGGRDRVLCGYIARKLLWA